jgi:hypothetical protein
MFVGFAKMNSGILAQAIALVVLLGSAYSFTEHDYTPFQIWTPVQQFGLLGIHGKWCQP